MNLIVVKNKYSILLVANLFHQLGSAKCFTELDLQSRYHQVKVAKSDEPKTAYVTRYDSFEFLVMIFKSTNAPAKFCTLMNKVLQHFLDRFVVVYLNNIVVYKLLLIESHQLR